MNGEILIILPCADLLWLHRSAFWEHVPRRGDLVNYGLGASEVERVVFEESGVARVVLQPVTHTAERIRMMSTLAWKSGIP